MAESLRNKTVKGVGWSAVDNISQIGVSFVVSVVLARLLNPDDYGLLGIIAIFTAVCNAIINGGFSSALIRKTNITDEDYNTTFWVNLIVSIILYILLFIFATAIASFFNRVELIDLTRVSSIGIIIGSLSIVQQTILTKKIDFKTQTKISLISSVGSGVIGILLALMDAGVWALVIQGLSFQLFRVILLFLFNKWHPKIAFSSSSFKDLFGFGWKIMISGLLNTVWVELNQVVIGKYYSPYALGQYTRAEQFSQLLSNNLTTVVQRVTYPVLSTIQDDTDRLVNAYRQIIKNTMFITAISMLFLAAISEPLLYCLIGPKWHDAALYLPLICITGSLYPLHSINLNMLQVQGRSDLFLGLEIIKKIIALAPLFIGAFMGILSMLIAGIVIGIISYFLNSYYTGKLLGYNSFAQLYDVAPSYGVALFISIPVFFLKFVPLTYWIILPTQLFLGGMLFVLVYRRSNLEEVNEIKKIINQVIDKYVKKQD